MLSQIKYPPGRRYKSRNESDPKLFFIDHFSNSDYLRFHLGFFSSKVFKTISEGFVIFILNGGKIDLIINHFLSDQDKILLSKNENISIRNNDTDIEVLRKLLNNLNKSGEHFFNCLAYLISTEKLNFIVVKPKGMGGYEHTKEGVFFDETNAVYFNGSANFTYSALVNNNENIVADPGWLVEERVEVFNNEFDSIWSTDNTDYIYLDAKDTTVLKNDILKRIDNKDLKDLIKESTDLYSDMDHESDLLKRRRKEIQYEICDQLNIPRFPYPQGPRKYQIDAYNNWIKNGKVGLFSMATGTGKTITALNCMLNEYNDMGELQAIILVPTNPLVDQWKEVCVAKKGGFNFSNIITSKDTKWHQSVKRKLLLKQDFILVCTYASICTNTTQSLLKEFSEKLCNIFLVADEAHNIGANKISSSIPVNFNRKLGLSATPDRKYDESGNSFINNFFNTSDPYYTYNFSMRKAINEGILCSYEYYPFFTTLTDTELEQYISLSKSIGKFFDSEGNLNTDKANKLLIKRKNIINKATNKAKLLKSILEFIRTKFPGFKYFFVYAPEGFEPNYSKDEDTKITDEEKRIIDDYAVIIGQDFGYTITKYTGETSNRDSILQSFKKGYYDGLLAMKCLDEGIDIPRTEFAIFCSSTGNPRQFIQRRGRVLRTHDKKVNSKVFDMIVVPSDDSLGFVEDYRKYERSLFKSELLRVVDFLALAENKEEIIRGPLGEICNKFDIDIEATIDNIILEKIEIDKKNDLRSTTSRI